MMGVSDAQRDSLVSRIYDINEKDFEEVALAVWKYQYVNNPLYHQYCELIGVGPQKVYALHDIPYLPIGMFRDHLVKTGNWDEKVVFRSSGSTASIRSSHAVYDPDWYHAVAEKCFAPPFGRSSGYVWMGLLPSYLERTDSSLVDMVHHFIQGSDHPESRFFPKVSDEIIDLMRILKQQGKPSLLIGVTFALLDLFEKTDVPVWDNLTVVETGGMKGRGQEITRAELYSRLRTHHSELRIESEYGMTEMMSQAYSKGDHFYPGPTMAVSIRDISDPLRLNGHGQRGAINVIDLANIDTCAFIATDDVGVAYEDGHFDVLGRLDNSDLRGCSLMYV